MVKFDEMMQWPKPVQKPHPPIIVGGGFPQGAAARRPTATAGCRSAAAAATCWP
jgi:alkanesulfonate monooxygenase SsuD/methylene tetrahydromethanopterin reductase-like flavin-dependent oxidoreductase (luciferase family)